MELRLNAPNSRMEPGPACVLSIVVPVYNEDEVLPMLHRRLLAAAGLVEGGVEIVYVDDGSTDRTAQVLAQLRLACPWVSVVRFSRNFGKEQALTAGLQLARGDAVVLIDADLQQPPEMIPAMVAAWRDGADVVNMRRRDRAGEGLVRSTAATMFYRLIGRLSDPPIPADIGDFRLLSRRAVDALNQLPERNRFMKGLFAWIGFRQTMIDFDHGDRAAGRSKWDLGSLLHLALEGITAFSVMPLRIASYVGLASALLAFGYGLYFLVKALVLGDHVAGFPTLIVVVLMLGGLQLLAIGVIGEYLGRLCIESKRRPLFLVEDYFPATEHKPVTPAMRAAVR